MTIQNDINLTTTFHHEVSLLLSYNCMFSSILDSIKNEFVYFYDSKGTPILSKSALKKYRKFVDKLHSYLATNQFSIDQTFVYIDDDWYDIIENYLIPSLQAIENDMKNHGLEFYSRITSYDRDNRPKYKDILERIEKLFT